ncbi:MAG: acyltransferase [Phascolarctobacterium sp.]|nr:acyltransferase [Phascolarctobacterium sp.]
MDLQTKKGYSLLDSTSERINILKLWLSIMVVYIHSSGTNITLTTGKVIFEVPVWLDTLKFVVSSAISNCAVPGFFFLSAILLYKNNFIWRENCKKKFITLFIPYIIMNTVWVIIFAIGQVMPLTSVFFANPDNVVSNWDIIRWLKAYGVISNIHPILYPLWFVRDLIIINFLAVIYKKIVDLSPKLFGGLLLILWLFPIPTYWMDYLLNKQTICFWGLGYLFVHYGIGLEKLDKYKKYIMWLYPACILADCLMRGTISGGIVHGFCCILGIAFWFTCFTTFHEGKIRNLILYFSSFSFFIYISHENTMSCFMKICYKFLPAISVVQAFTYIIVPFIIVGWCIMFGSLLRKYVPSVYKIITGNRVR